jgi:hypothetical protein
MGSARTRGQQVELAGHLGSLDSAIGGRSYLAYLVSIKRFALGTLLAVGLFVAGVPVHAAVTPPPPAPLGTMTQAQAEALYQAATPPTAAQLAAAMAYANSHPFQGSAVPILAPSSGKTYRGVTPNVTGGINWWGVRLNLTNADIHEILKIIVTGGFTAAGAAICARFGWVAAAACGIVGAIFGYIVAEIVWNQLWNNHGCGAWIQYRWAWPSGWSWGLAC